MGIKNGRQITTLFSDASYDNKRLLAGYGVWGKSDRGTFTSGGYLEAVPNINIAEFVATARAIKAAWERGILLEKDYLIVKTDNLHVVNVMQSIIRINCPVQTQIRDTLRNFAAKRDIVLEYQHVKGHNKDRQPRSYVNNLCDEIAKKQLNLIRTTKKGTGNAETGTQTERAKNV